MGSMRVAVTRADAAEKTAEYFSSKSRSFISPSSPRQAASNEFCISSSQPVGVLRRWFNTASGAVGANSWGRQQFRVLLISSGGISGSGCNGQQYFLSTECNFAHTAGIGLGSGSLGHVKIRNSVGLLRRAGSTHPKLVLTF